MSGSSTALDEFRKDIDAHGGKDGAYPNLAVMTSAVRDACNGQEFAERVRSECGLDARILTGEEEARMTFLGAMSGRPSAVEPTVVVDIGGGSTEFVVGVGKTAGFHVSLPAGVVRMSERHIHGDPPAPAELQEIASDTRAVYLAGLPEDERAPVRRGIAVAGTATSAAAIDQELDPYDHERVHGYPLLLATVEMLLARLADMDEAQRREVVGLDPEPRAHDRRGHGPAVGGDARVRPGRSRGLRARHPPWGCAVHRYAQKFGLPR